MRQGQKRNFARHLRREMTDAERHLWFFLRNRSLIGCKFRRQVPIGPCIPDFACLEAGLIIELDGGQHAASLRADTARTAHLHAAGYRVLRFWNNDVLTRTDAVLEAIHAVLAGGPHSNPSPASGRGAQHEQDPTPCPPPSASPSHSSISPSAPSSRTQNASRR